MWPVDMECIFLLDNWSHIWYIQVSVEAQFSGAAFMKLVIVRYFTQIKKIYVHSYQHKNIIFIHNTIYTLI
jgi:hypothetical protein